MNKKVLLTATVQSHIAQFHKPLINILKENGYEVHIAARDNLAEKNGLSIDNADEVFDVPFSRSPKSPDNIKAYKKLKEILERNQYEIIHCNTPMGGIITRLASRKSRKNGSRVIYTAHGFHFYKGAPIVNWLVYYPIEKIFAKLTDDLITINNEDYQLAKRKMKSNIHKIHGVGADSARYNLENVEPELRSDLGLSDDDFVIICVGELNSNKNQKQLIKAVSLLKESKIKVLLAGNGPMKSELEDYIKETKTEDTVQLIGYKSDLERYIKISDLVVSMSIREGLGLNIIEAMMCQKPVIVSDNRGHRDLVKDGYEGYMVNTHDFNALAERILQLYQNRDLCKKMGEYNIEQSRKFRKENVVNELMNIYGIGKGDNDEQSESINNYTCV